MGDTDAFIQNLGGVRSKLLLYYEAITLAKSLTMVCQGINPVRQPEEDIEVERPQTHGPEKSFQYYLKKVAEICMNIPGSKHITSVGVLQEPAGIVYLFASNKRAGRELAEMEQFVRSLFDTVNVADGVFRANTSRIFGNLFRQIILFNKDRIKLYLNRLKAEFSDCIDIQTHHPISPNLADLLPTIQNCEKFVLEICDKTFDNKSKSESEFVSSMRKLLIDLREFKRILGFIYNPSRFGNTPSCWTEAKHVIGRLLSYDNASNAIMETRRVWPELFTTEVQFELLPSSIPMPNPFPPKRRNEPAEGIITRLFSNPTERATCLDQAAHLEHMTSLLDKEIRSQLKKPDFKPIIHAEMLILDWMERTGRGLTPDRFFNHQPYIGSSKPTCRLCWLYFTSHPSGVQIRPTHQNIYPAWRMPNSYAAVDATTEKDRLYVLDRMRDNLRQLCKRTLQDRQPRRKNRDSETSSSKPSQAPWLGVLDGPSTLLEREGPGHLETGGNYPMSEWKMMRRLDTISESSSLAPSTSSSDIRRGLAELSVEGGSSTSRGSRSTASAGDSPRMSSDDRGSLVSVNSSGGGAADGDGDSDDGGGVVLYKGRAGRGRVGGK